jgi:hypothetical protein
VISSRIPSFSIKPITFHRQCSHARSPPLNKIWRHSSPYGSFSCTNLTKVSPNHPVPHHRASTSGGAYAERAPVLRWRYPSCLQHRPRRRKEGPTAFQHYAHPDLVKHVIGDLCLPGFGFAESSTTNCLHQAGAILCNSTDVRDPGYRRLQPRGHSANDWKLFNPFSEKNSLRRSQ